MPYFCQEYINAASSLVTEAWQLMNSNFFTALAGAFAGAGGATWIAARNERRRLLLEEIRNTNAAILLASSIGNQFCNVKHQHVHSLKESYDKNLKDYEEFRSKVGRGDVSQGQIFDLEFNLVVFPPVSVPIVNLKTLLLEKISVTGRPLLLVENLSQCIDAFNLAAENRRQAISRFHANKDSKDMQLCIYFGLPDKDGNVDKSYPNIINSMFRDTNYCLIFSKFLCEDLNEHGKELAQSYGRSAPKIHKAKFSKMEQEGMMPDSSLYPDWVNMKKDFQGKNK